ncbi:Cell morphogenesis protein PAG1, partial [Kickxella alabastrina]
MDARSYQERGGHNKSITETFDDHSISQQDTTNAHYYQQQQQHHHHHHHHHHYYHQHHQHHQQPPGIPFHQDAQAGSIEQYAIRMLYEEFRDRAAHKIDSIVELRLDREPGLAKYLEPGADLVFDRTLEKLGQLARRRPRVIIELLLVWRKTTVDAAAAADEYPLEPPAVVSAAVGSGMFSASGLDPLGKPTTAAAALSRANYIVKERRSLASVYILCRALSYVVRQLEATHLEGDLGDRLEELVFGQVKQANPTNLRRSHNRREIQDMYARLIGLISEIRFASMSDRFIAELERIPMVGGGRGSGGGGGGSGGGGSGGGGGDGGGGGGNSTSSSSSNNDERIVALLHNMRFLRLRVFPIDALEESSAFLLSCAKFYSRTTGSLRLKHAWATLLTELLMPMAAVVDAEVNLPELVQAIDIIYTKAMKMAAKVRHVNVAFPLAAATLCISRRDVFHQRWLSLLEYCIQRLKDKQFRRVSMDAILRMFWVYLFRYPEANAVVLRRIDSLSRIFFPATKLHAWPKTVPPAAFVYFLTCAACYSFDFAMRQLLQNMLQIDSAWPGTTRDIAEAGPILDTLNPARVGLAFQALLSVAAIASNKAAAAAASAAAAAAANAGSKGASNKHGGGGSSNVGGSSNESPADPVTLKLQPPFPGVAQLSGLDVFGLASQSGKGSGGGDSVHHRGGVLSIDGSIGDGGGSGGGGSGGGAGAGGGSDRALGNSFSATIGASSDASASTAAPTPASGPGAFSNRAPGASQPPFIVPDNLPDNIRKALSTAIGVVARYFNVLYPVFGHYVLADERLWRLTRTVPPMSSVVLTGSTFSFENTALLVSSAASSREHQAAGANGISASAGGPIAVGGASAAAVQTSRALTMAEDPGTSGSAGETGAGMGDANSGGADDSRVGSDAAASILRQAAARYPVERQVYLDLMSVYTRNVPRSQMFWEQADLSKLIDIMVQNILHVDQTLAAESRACLLDLLCPPSVRRLFDTRTAARLFATSFDRLLAISQAVTRATQILRATDERFSEILAGGIFSRDSRSSVSFAQPGDPLSDAPGVWPFGMSQVGGVGGNSSGGRRFIHAANLSTTSNTSASAAAAAATATAASGGIPPPLGGDFSSRSFNGAMSDPGEDSVLMRHAHSLSGQIADEDFSDLEESSSAAAAVAAALDTKARLQKSTFGASASATAGELNGGFLH